MKNFFIFISSAFLLFPAATYAAEKGCLSYEPAKNTLEGRLSYKKIKDTYEKGVFVLLLQKPICLNRAEDGDELNIAEQNVTTIQLQDSDKTYFSNIGHKVAVTGTLFHAHTIHHHTNVLMMNDKALTILDKK